MDCSQYSQDLVFQFLKNHPLFLWPKTPPFSPTLERQLFHITRMERMGGKNMRQVCLVRTHFPFAFPGENSFCKTSALRADV